MEDLPPMTDILLLLRKRIAVHSIDLMPAGALQLASPTSLDVLRKAEATLGFNLPPLLIQVYTEVANGGFGPGYGLLGLAGGFADDLGDTALQSYLHRRADQSLQWRDALLPICHWGCAIYSCVDCAKSTFPVVLFDPNLANTQKDLWRRFVPDCTSFSRWMKMWANGENLWERMYADDGPIARRSKLKKHAVTRLLH
jgi:hypothetical protein